MIIRYQESIEREESDDEFSPGQSRKAGDAINSERTWWSIMEGSGKWIFGFGLECEILVNSCEAAQQVYRSWKEAEAKHLYFGVIFIMMIVH